MICCPRRSPTRPLNTGGRPSALALAGQVANQYAARDVFSDYRARKAANTLRQQDGGLALFADYLWAAGIPTPAHRA